jgi:hypothetical protein
VGAMSWYQHFIHNSFVQGIAAILSHSGNLRGGCIFGHTFLKNSTIGKKKLNSQLPLLLATTKLK